jgi:hypothetical protein
MPDEKAEAIATYTARGQEDAPAAPRHASLIGFGEINCVRPGDPQNFASQGVQLPVATAHTGKLTAAALRGLDATGQERCFSAPRQASAHKSRLSRTLLTHAFTMGCAFRNIWPKQPAPTLESRRSIAPTAPIFPSTDRGFRKMRPEQVSNPPLVRRRHFGRRTGARRHAGDGRLSSTLAQ